MRLARRHGFDALIVAATVMAVVEVTVGRHAENAPHMALWLAIPAVALIVLPLLARHRFPFAAPAALWALAAAISAADGRLVVSANGLFLGGLAAAYLLGSAHDAHRQRIGLAIVLTGAAVVAYDDPRHSGAELVFIPILFAIAWLVGLTVRDAQARVVEAERERETAARIAVAEERARIARELHDIVAHAMSVMVLQVGAVRRRVTDEQDSEALEAVERAGRTALAEMRRLLGAMRSETDELDLTPQPGLGNLQPLLEEIRRAGLPVELHVEGEPFALPHAIDLSAYRIVQEGLTNALKHAHAGRADVLVHYGADELRIEVRDDGRGPAAGDGRGHGLIGIRERVKLYGGRVTFGAADGHGFVLSTTLPLVGAER